MTMEYLPLKDKYFSTSKEIKSINNILNDLKDNIKLIEKNNKELYNSIKNFNSIYETYYRNLNGLKRFSIPVFGKISSGKSTLLNYCLKLHGILETDSDITTRFICIIRHNPDLVNKPKIYRVKVIEREKYVKDGQEITLYNFEKDYKDDKDDGEIKGDIKEIIKNRNHILDNPEFDKSNWKQYFMILETNIPLFEGFNKRYSNLFEFLDVPGLNEFTGEKDNKKHFFFKERITFFIHNVAFCLYIFDMEKKESGDSTAVLTNIMNQYFDNNPNKQKYSIYVLNKIDKINNPKEELEHLKSILYEKCHIEKNGFFIGLSGLLLYLKRFKYESFFDYLFCIIEEYKIDEDLNIDEYISKKMSKDFGQNIEENLDYGDDDTIDFPKEEKDKLNKFNKEVTKKLLGGELSVISYNYYKDYFIKYSKNKKEDLGEQHKNFESLLIQSFDKTINDYLDNFKDKDLKNKLLKELGLTEKDLEKIELKETTKFIESDPFELLNSVKNILNSLNLIQPNDPNILDLLKEHEETYLCMKQKKIKIPLLGEYSSGKSSLLNSLIGYNYNILPVGVNVCTNIALVIQYTKDEKNISLFHTFLEKTSKGLYIFNKDNNPIVQGPKKINSVLNLLNELFNSSTYKINFQNKIIEFIQNHKNLDDEELINLINILIKLINKELLMETINDKDLKKTLEKLFNNSNDINDISNENNNTFYQRAFFLLTVPIEAYDIMELSNDIKESIELIDFPGLDSTDATKNKYNIFESEVLQHLLQFSDGFIFVNKGNSIMEEAKVNILKNIINHIQNRKKFEFTFKSCLFILNRCDEAEINIEESKKKYEEIFKINNREKTWNDIISISKKVKDSDNYNITKFSSKLYYKYKCFKDRINDFDNYINEYEMKIDKKYTGKNYLLYLRKKVYFDVCSISKEKYNTMKNISEDIKKYQEHFKTFLTVDENKSIILDIIRMYIFIKNSIKDLKFYKESNAEDFFQKFKNQLDVSREFYKGCLKNILLEFFNQINAELERINIRIIINPRIKINFEEKDFENAKNNLDEKLKIKKREFEPLIDSKFDSMNKEFDELIKNFKEGNFKSYDKSIEETNEKIIAIKTELEKLVNEEVENFKKTMSNELQNFVEVLLVKIQKENIDIDANSGINKTEKELFSDLGSLITQGVGSVITGTGYIIRDLAKEPPKPAETSIIGGLIAAGVKYITPTISNMMPTLTTALTTNLTTTLTTSLTTIGIGVGVGALVCLSFAGLIHGGFSLYKKFNEKSNYIEEIKRIKKDINNEREYYKNEVYYIFEKLEKESQVALVKFKKRITSDIEGIKSRKDEYINLYKQFIELYLQLKRITD